MILDYRKKFQKDKVFLVEEVLYMKELLLNQIILNKEIELHLVKQEIDLMIDFNQIGIKNFIIIISSLSSSIS